MKTMRHLLVGVAGACVATICPIALAQSADYPTKLIKIVVPFPAGGATDIMTRNIAQKLNEVWKQPIVVDNKPGAKA